MYGSFDFVVIQSFQTLTVSLKHTASNPVYEIDTQLAGAGVK